MSTLNISLPDALKSFVDAQDRQHLRGLLLAVSAMTTPGGVHVLL